METQWELCSTVKVSRICEFRVIMGTMTGLLGCCSSSTFGSKANDYVKTIATLWFWLHHLSCSLGSWTKKTLTARSLSTKSFAVHHVGLTTHPCLTSTAVLLNHISGWTWISIWMSLVYLDIITYVLFYPAAGLTNLWKQKGRPDRFLVDLVYGNPLAGNPLSDPSDFVDRG